MTSMRSFLQFIPQQLLEAHRHEFISIRFKELVLKLHPMQSQGMQKAFHNIHAH